MFIFFIMGLALGGMAVAFALQNANTITVLFFGWQLTGSQSLILIFTMLIGVLVTLLILLPDSVNSHFRYRSLEKEMKKVEDELRKQKELMVFSKKTSPSQSAIAKIENGAIFRPELKPVGFLKKIYLLLKQKLAI